jgi:hypothetical protein
LVGLPGLASFNAKETILAQTLIWSIENGSITNYYITYIVAVIAFTSTFLTTLYLGRSFLLVFCGTSTWEKHAELPIRNLLKNNYLKSMQGSMLALSTCVIIFSILPIKQIIIDGLTKANINYSLHQLTITKPTNAHLLTMSISIGSLLLAIIFLVVLSRKSQRTITVPHPNNLTQIFFQGWYMDILTNSFTKQIIILSNYTTMVEKYLVNGFIKRLTNTYITVACAVAWIDNKLVAGFIRCLTIGYVIAAHIVAWIDNKLIDGIGCAIAIILKSVSKLYLQIQKSSTQRHIAWSFMSMLLILIGWMIYNRLLE